MPDTTDQSYGENGSSPSSDDAYPDPFEEGQVTEPIPDIGVTPEDANSTEPLSEPTLATYGPPQDEAPITLDVVERSEVGLVRQRNEDACLFVLSQNDGQSPLLPFALFIVADGMGGHADGHIASRRAARLVAAQVLYSVLQPLLQERDLVRQVPVQDVLVDAIQTANYEIFSPEPEREGGTTLTAALVLGRRLFLAHVGDTRAYLWHAGRMEQLTTDHSYVQRLQETGQLSASEAAAHPQRNVLYRAVGQGSNLEVDTSTRKLPSSGQLLLCSDGLWGLVPDSTLNSILADSKLSLAEKNNQLVEEALMAGGVDNITSVLASWAS